MNYADKIKDNLQQLMNEEKYSEAINYLKNLIESETEITIKNELIFTLLMILFYQGKLSDVKQIIDNIREKEINPYFYIIKAKLESAESNIKGALKYFANFYTALPSETQILHPICNLIDKLNEQELNQENKSKLPLISIILLCYNKLHYTQKCIKSILKNTNYENFELIVYDNASIDETPVYLETYGNKIKFVRNNSNKGFIGGNNEAVKHAKGDYLIFLNNDTEVMADWLISLYNTFVLYPDAGAVGSMLVFPNGTLQEAGGIVFQDASGWNYGRNEIPNLSLYNFVREVDYCSGASLMVKTDLFHKIGGFDMLFYPAYYEDTDLCFAVRKMGYKVYYCPHSKIIHYEGITNGVDTGVGYKKHQIANRPKFQKKWEKELKNQKKDSSELLAASDRTKYTKRVLIVDDAPPLPDRASGVLKMYNTVEEMLKLGYKVTYAYLTGAKLDKVALKHLKNLQLRGVELIHLNYEQWWSIRKTDAVNTVIQDIISYTKIKERKIDLIYICFYWVADYFIDELKKVQPNTPILIDSVDIHYLRKQREAELYDNKELLKEANEVKKIELKTYEKADCLTAVSLKEVELLKKHFPDKPVFLMSNIHPIRKEQPSFSERKDIMFIGGFNHPPNVNAVLFFVENIFPLIKRKIKDIKFYVVGSNPKPEILALNSDDVIVTGWVPDSKEYLDKCRIEVVPLRYGAGVKGKVGEAFSNGLPIVTTTVGAEGMFIENNVHAYVADDPAEFADKVIDLYFNEETWNRFSNNGKKLIEKLFSTEAASKRIKHVMSFENKNQFLSKRALNNPEPPKVSIIIPVFNKYDYTEQCVEAINKHTNYNYEILIIDNASTDGTYEKLLSHHTSVRIIKNDKNLGFPMAINIGFKEALGEYIIVLNNDVLVNKHWLDELLNVAESDEQIGIVGPVSNKVSGVQLDKNADYNNLSDMEVYAEKVYNLNKGKTFDFPRVAFLCTLIKRNVIEKIGGLEEFFTPGNYEDDDFCLRAQIAGYKTKIALSVFVHHFGSVSFQSLENNPYEILLEKNKNKFISKWGATPDEIWLNGKPIKAKYIEFPLRKDKAAENLERAEIYLNNSNLEYSDYYLSRCLNEINAGNNVLGIDKQMILNLRNKIEMINKNNE